MLVIFRRKIRQGVTSEKTIEDTVGLASRRARLHCCGTPQIKKAIFYFISSSGNLTNNAATPGANTTAFLRNTPEVAPGETENQRLSSSAIGQQRKTKTGNSARFPIILLYS